jgi:hypothetical protein
MTLHSAASEVVDSYLRAGIGGVSEKKWAETDAPGDESVRLRAVRVCQPEGACVSTADMTSPLHIEMEVAILKPMKEVGVAVRILSMEGQILLHTADLLNVRQRSREPSTYTYTCILPPFALNSGSFLLTVGADVPNERLIFWLENVLSFNVESTSPEMGRYQAQSWVGVMGPGLGAWSVRESTGLLS